MRRKEQLWQVGEKFRERMTAGFEGDPSINVTDCFLGGHAADLFDLQEKLSTLGSAFMYLPLPMCRIAVGKVLSEPHCLKLG